MQGNNRVSSATAIISGTEGADDIWAKDTDHVYGLGGDDIIRYGAHIDGGSGNDTIYDGSTDSTIIGGSGNDAIYDSYGSDIIDAGAGNDYVAFGSLHARDTDVDRADLGDGNDTVEIPALLLGASAQRVVSGGAGIDTVIIADGNAYAGVASLDFRPMASGGTVSLGGLKLSGFERVVLYDTMTIQNVQFWDLDDYFYGYGNFNKVFGNGGDDFIDSGGVGDELHGGDGNDTIVADGGGNTQVHQAFGDAGNDLIFSRYKAADYSSQGYLSGGAGSDGFINIGVGTTAQRDTILDFNPDQDWLGFGFQGGYMQYETTVTRPIAMVKSNIVDNDSTLSFDTTYYEWGYLTAHVSYNKITGELSVEIGDRGSEVQFLLAGAPKLTLDDFFSMTLQHGGPESNVIYGDNTANYLTGDDPSFPKSGADDVIFGEGGDDLIYGGRGNDRMYGGAGDDVYSVSDVGDQTIEGVGQGFDVVESSINWVLASNVEGLELQGASHLNGTGNALNNVLIGNSGNNLLNGGAGNDYMAGGAGNDIFVVAAAGDSTVENAGGGIDTVRSYISWALGANIERLELQGTGNLNGVGNTLANTLVGNSGNNSLSGGGGNDTLDGGAGNDTMAGGTGNDIYVVTAAGDTTTERVGEGTDTVRSFGHWTLGANFEWLELQGTGNLNGTGNTLNNVLVGNSGSNALIGVDGHDYISAGSGDDTLDGGIGNDTLIGGAGRDILIGGAGNDIFDFNLVSDSPSGPTFRDTISGFSRGFDRIDLAGVDANTLAGGNQAFSFIGKAAFSGKAGELRYSAYGNACLVGADINGDKLMDFQIAVNGTHWMTGTDFLL